MTTCPQSKLFNNQFENMEKRFTRIEERTEASFKDLQWSIKNIETLLNKSVTEQKVFNENVVLKKDLKDTVQEMKQNNEKYYFPKNKWNIIVALWIIAFLAVISILIMLINKIYGTNFIL